MSDNVNHPAHYEGNTSLECIDVMEIAFGAEATSYFCICNAFKYLWRYKHKNGLEDLEKAGWYLDKFQDIAGTCTADVLEKYGKLKILLHDAVEGIEVIK